MAGGPCALPFSSLRRRIPSSFQLPPFGRSHGFVSCADLILSRPGLGNEYLSSESTSNSSIPIYFLKANYLYAPPIVTICNTLSLSRLVILGSQREYFLKVTLNLAHGGFLYFFKKILTWLSSRWLHSNSQARIHPLTTGSTRVLISQFIPSPRFKPPPMFTDPL